MEGLVQHALHIYDGLGARIGVIQDNAEEEPMVDEMGPEIEAQPAQHGERDVPVEAPHSTAPDDVMVDDDLGAMEYVPPTADELLEEGACTLLFTGSRLTQLGGTLLLLNCLRTHSASNQLVNELFEILSKSMLPTMNSLPRNEYHASKVLKRLGLAYDTIHCYPGPRTCVLFRGEELKDLTACPNCGG